MASNSLTSLNHNCWVKNGFFYFWLNRLLVRTNLTWGIENMKNPYSSSFTTDELPGYLDRKCTESFTASSNCAWNSQLTWGRGRWPCGSWPHLRCHSDPWRAWLRRWGPDEAFQPHRRWTESEGSAAPCLELLLSADPGFQAKKKKKKNISQTLLSFYNISDLTKADYYFLSSLIYKDTKLGIKYYKLR